MFLFCTKAITFLLVYKKVEDLCYELIDEDTCSPAGFWSGSWSYITTVDQTFAVQGLCSALRPLIDDLKDGGARRVGSHDCGRNDIFAKMLTLPNFSVLDKETK